MTPRYLCDLVQGFVPFPWRHRAREREANVLPVHSELSDIRYLDQHMSAGRKVSHANCEHILIRKTNA